MEVSDKSPSAAESSVLTIAANASLREAARTLRDERVGALVVVDSDGRGIGMITDRDLTVRAVAWDKDPGRPVSEVMSSPLDSLGPDQVTVPAAVQALRSKARRRLPVCVDGKPIGMVSFDDLFDSISGSLSDLAAIQASRLREVSEAPRILSELQQGLARARELRWKAQATFLDDLDSFEKRLQRVLNEYL